MKLNMIAVKRAWIQPIIAICSVIIVIIMLWSVMILPIKMKCQFCIPLNTFLTKVWLIDVFFPLYNEFFGCYDL